MSFYDDGSWYEEFQDFTNEPVQSYRFKSKTIRSAGRLEITTLDRGCENTIIMDDSFTMPILDWAYGPRWIHQTWPIPMKPEHTELLQRELNEFNPSFLYSHKNNVTAIRAENKLWGNLGPFAIRMNEKVNKRLSVVNWQTRLFRRWERVIFTVGIPVFWEGELVDIACQYIPHDDTDRMLSICIIDHEGPILDGNSYARNEIFTVLTADAYDRMKEAKNEHTDEFMREMERASALQVRAFLPPGSMRVLSGTEAGEYSERLDQATFLKGDLLRSFRNLPADIVTSWDNLKSELYSKDGAAYLVAQPVTEKLKAQTNRQNVAFFFNWLYAGKIEPALQRQNDEMLEIIKGNKLPWFVRSALTQKPDSIGAYQQKFINWTSSKLPIYLSEHLTRMMAGQYTAQLHPRGGRDDSRRFPIPHSCYLSIRSVFDLKMCYDDVNIALADGECYVHHGTRGQGGIGFVTNDKTFDYLRQALGMGDKDDHATGHFGRVTHDAYGYRAGDMVVVLVRNPIGTKTDGKRWSAEYYVLSVHPFTEEWVESKWGPAPPIDLRKRPNHVFEITNNQGNPNPPVVIDPKLLAKIDKIRARAERTTFEGERNNCYAMIEKLLDEAEETVPIFPWNEYTKDFVFHSMKLAAEAAGLYGQHANLVMAAAQHNIVLEYMADEEWFIDSCTQNIAQWKLDLIRNKNNRDSATIRDAGVLLDPLTLKRITISPLPLFNDPNGIFSTLAFFHKNEISRFNEQINEIVTASRQILLDLTDSVIVNQKPRLLVRLEQLAAAKRRELRVGTLTNEKWAAIGNTVVELMQRKLTTAEQEEMIMHSIIWSLRNPGTGAWDQMLCQGAVMPLFTESLKKILGQ